MTSYVLIDTSYIFHRVTACEIWCKKSHNEFDDDAVLNNFQSSIEKLSKKLNVSVTSMILCRDDHMIRSWRTNLYKSYKEHRKYSDSKDYGPYIKELYRRIEKLFPITIRVKHAEADDIIGILTFYLIKQNRKNHVYIISNDKDFYQLPVELKTTRIHLLDNSKFKEADTSDFVLEDKIIKGDRSDNVKRLPSNYTTSEYLRNKQLVDLSYSPRWIQDRIFEMGYFPLDQNVKPLSIQLGFACINTELRKQNIFCSRTCRLETILKTGGIKLVKKLIRKNLDDLEKLVDWNYEYGIRFMRISSELMPHVTNPDAPKYSIEQFRSKLQRIGKKARWYKQRLTFHPGQFNILSTPKKDVLDKTRDELEWHATILDMMGMDQDSVMIIHGGGLYGDKESAINRFIDNYKTMPECVKRRLVLENCEKCYNIEDVLRISNVCNIPIVFDTHHYNCYNICKDCLPHPPEYYIPYILESWKRKDIKPKFHVSEQRCDSRLGAHSDYIEEIPNYLLEIPEKYGVDIDIMIEAKMKERSVFKLYEKYPQLSPY